MEVAFEEHKRILELKNQKDQAQEPGNDPETSEAESYKSRIK